MVLLAPEGVDMVDNISIHKKGKQTCHDLRIEMVF